MNIVERQRAPDPGEASRLARSRERELNGWARSMGTSPERLTRAVQAVGITPRKVRAYLRSTAEPAPR